MARQQGTDKMKNITGLSGKVLEVNLTDQNYSVVQTEQKVTRLYLGAKGLALKLLYDRFTPGTDPLGPENLLIIHTGAYMGTGAPCSGRFSAVSKSPLTNIITSSSCGGPFGMALKTSGWDGLIIRGKSEMPLVLEIGSEGVKFINASGVWGKYTDATQEEFKAKGSGMLAIGPAGENLVRYANIISGHRFLGRSGLGAVMGSKNLKAVIARGGEYKVVPARPDYFKKIRKAFIDDINNNEYTSVYYSRYGTAANVRWSEENNMLPVNNFRDGTHTDFDSVSGQTLEKKHMTGHSTCKPCSILCGHKGVFNDKEQQVPEYETIGMLGTCLGIFDPEKIAIWNETCRKLGFDTISAGATLAWAMEAGEKGLFETDLRFGSAENINRTLKEIGAGKGTGKELANGTRWLADKYGGHQFAMQVKGLESAAYDPRGAYGHGLGLATANRGADHLSASMMVSQAFSKFSFKFRRTGNPFQVAFFEDLFAAINSLQTCQFTAYAVFGERYLVKYLPRIIIRILIMVIPQVALKIISVKRYYQLYSAITGVRLNGREFRRCGRRIHILERYMNTREGISASDDTLPGRFLNEKRLSDRANRMVPLDKMIRKYYWYRGYDRSGIPTARALRRLKIS